MIKKVNLTVIILTYNEEVNIIHSISNVIDWANDVYVLDSGSTDKTVEIAENLGAKVFYRKFDTYAKQRNYAIRELPIETEWILFLDADEYLTDELKDEIGKILPITDKNGFYMKRRFYFMGKWIKHGGYYPTKLLRLFKKDKGKVERDINEQFIVDGDIGELQYDFVDENHKGIYDWIEKHNRYSSFEAQELLNYEKRVKEGDNDSYANLFGTSPQRKRWIREYIWNPLLPPLFRPFFYFIYRYFLRLGFLDGKEGLMYFLLHSFCMVLPTSIKYYELKKQLKKDKNL
jgi:glycosyltransferase involved in cell wall biosynthesis